MANKSAAADYFPAGITDNPYGGGSQNPDDPENPTVVLGDWNNDGAVNATDLANYRKYIAGNATVVASLSDALKAVVDINSDGNVDLVDLVQARLIAAN